MKKYLLPKEGKFYKANLHCHSNRSDGRLSPEELKKLYVENGYSIIAFTDHDILLSHSYLNDENFLALHGFEMEINEQKKEDFPFIKTCHICFIAIDKDNLVQPCYHREYYLFANAPKYRDQIIFDTSLPDYWREYSHEGISEIMAIGRKKGFFVTYNHPTWSGETLNEYGGYKNMHAMEIVNNGCLVGGFNDYNDKEYDEMLQAGNRIFCIAADDNHNCHPKNSKLNDSCGGWTMIKAPNLEYNEITSALLKGNFYSSQGPEIFSLFVEDGVLYIECSPAESIILNTAHRIIDVRYPEEGKPLTCASFVINKDSVYVRLTITDEKGKHANTNAYFLDEIF